MLQIGLGRQNNRRDGVGRERQGEGCADGGMERTGKISIFTIKTMDHWNLNELFEFDTKYENQNKYLIQKIASDSDNDKELFNLTLHAIIIKYTDCIDRGQIIEGINFLEHHYKFTKKKKLYLRFIRYYILSKSWMTEETKKKYTLNDKELLKWVQKKEKRNKKILRLVFLFLLIIALVLLAITKIEYKNLIIGAVIGSSVALIVKSYEKILE